jgi:hypothetical protein
MTILRTLEPDSDNLPLSGNVELCMKSSLLKSASTSLFLEWLYHVHSLGLAGSAGPSAEPGEAFGY